LAFFVATGFGVGLVPFAPGTFGSLLGIPLYALAVFPLAESIPATLTIVAGLVAPSCWVAGIADRSFPEHDNGKIVIDEVAGMLLALVWHPPTLLNVATLFLLFRFFDVVKVWPANRIDRRLGGGAGVVLDDLVSGIYANLAGRLLL